MEPLVRRELVVSVILVFCPSSLFAQTGLEATPVSPGARVRVTPEPGAGPRLVGTFSGYMTDTLWLRVGQSPAQAVSRSQLMRFEVSRGQRSYWRVGMLTGFVLGTAVGLLSTQGKTYDDWGQVIPPPVLQVVGGMTLGAITGAGVGSAIRRDRWETVEWLPSAPPASGAPHP